MPLTSQHSQRSSWMCRHGVSLAPRLPVSMLHSSSLSGVRCGSGVTEVLSISLHTLHIELQCNDQGPLEQPSNKVKTAAKHSLSIFLSFYFFLRENLISMSSLSLYVNMYTYVNKQKTTMKTSYRESEMWFTNIWITAEDSGYILNLSHSCCFILFPQKKQVLFFSVAWETGALFTLTLLSWLLHVHNGRQINVMWLVVTCMQSLSSSSLHNNCMYYCRALLRSLI